MHYRHIKIPKKSKQKWKENSRLTFFKWLPKQQSQLKELSLSLSAGVWLVLLTFRSSLCATALSRTKNSFSPQLVQSYDAEAFVDAAAHETGIHCWRFSSDIFLYFAHWNKTLNFRFFYKNAVCCNIKHALIMAEWRVFLEVQCDDNYASKLTSRLEGDRCQDRLRAHVAFAG